MLKESESCVGCNPEVTELWIVNCPMTSILELIGVPNVGSRLREKLGPITVPEPGDEMGPKSKDCETVTPCPDKEVWALPTMGP